MTQVTINGNTYSDDGTTVKDMQHGGHRQWLLPMIGDAATVIGAAQLSADNAALSEAAAAASAYESANYAAAINATSTTSLAIGTGVKVFTVPANKQFTAGQFVIVTRSGGAGYMWGTCTSYVADTLTLDIQLSSGSGTHTDWIISLSSPKGADGTSAPVSLNAQTAEYTALVADKGSVISCTGTWSLLLTAAATLEDGWWVYVKNAGTGVITITPASGETIDGATTLSVSPNETVLIQCTGSEFTSVFIIPKIINAPIFSSAVASANALSGTQYVHNATIGKLQMCTRIAQNGSIFIASGATADKVSSSADGRTWTLRTMPASKAWVVASDGSGFLAIVGGDTVTAYSAGGITWGAAASFGSAVYATIAAVAGIYIVRGSASTTTIYKTTNNGSSWSTETGPVANASTYLSTGGVFMIHVAASAKYWTSTTGGTGSWTERNMPTGCDVLYPLNDGSVIARKDTSAGAVPFYRTTNGIDWTELFVPLSDSAGLILINGIYYHGASATVAYTRHNGAWMQRSNVGIYGSASVPVSATIGDVTAIVGGINWFVIDPTAEDAATAIFIG